MLTKLLHLAFVFTCYGIHVTLSVPVEDGPGASPHITSIRPEKGPQSGSTKLEIFGEHFDPAARIEVAVGSHTCHVIRHLQDVIECITSSATEVGNVAITLKLENTWYTFENTIFHYVDDPQITGVKTGEYGQVGIARGHPCGGGKLIVNGSNFDSVQNPSMFVASNHVHYNSSTCAVKSSSRMTCRTPAVDSSGINFGYDEYVELEYGFRMDGVASLLDLSSHEGFSKFHLYPDPVVHPFEDENQIKHLRSDYLTFYGQNIDRVFEGEDVHVRIGTDNCPVVSISRSQITCRPPASQPQAEEGQALPKVEVEIQDKLKFSIGRLSYEQEPPSQGLSHAGGD